MKFCTIITASLTLLSTTSFARSIQPRDTTLKGCNDSCDMSKVKDPLAYFTSCSSDSCEIINEDEDNGGHACTEAIEKECSAVKVKDAKTMIETVCPTYDHAKCENLIIKGNFDDLPQCKGKNKKYLDELKEMYKSYIPFFEMYCTKDENGKLCPFAELYTIENQGKPYTEPELWLIMKDVCQSKKCSDILTENIKNKENLYSKIVSHMSEDEKLTKFIENKCPAKLGDTTFYDQKAAEKTSANSTSDASKINLSGALFVTLSLLFINLF